ncbi:MAG: hypothetical protein CM1200mP2_19720 [Planctomycetaceae bacterium]|nr:MAG: hypothetical protein CM1200mP2_19720 [Planctomycetaceae bacterium]
MSTKAVSPSRLPMATILPALMATSARRLVEPVPSMMVPPRRTSWNPFGSSAAAGAETVTRVSTSQSRATVEFNISMRRLRGGARMWEQGKTIRIYWMHVESIALVGCCPGRSVAGESDRVRG